MVLENKWKIIIAVIVMVVVIFSIVMLQPSLHCTNCPPGDRVAKLTATGNCREFCIDLMREAVNMNQNESIIKDSEFCTHKFDIYNGDNDVTCEELDGTTCIVSWSDGSSTQIVCSD